MQNPISFMGANYVCREIGFVVPEGSGGLTGWWGVADQATQSAFAPIDTYHERFDEIVADVAAMGFDHMDVWLAHLNPEWATDEHVAVALEVLTRHGMKVSSLAGGFGATREVFTRSCEIASALDCGILGGFAPILQTDRRFVLDTLADHGVKLALENHPEKNPGEVRELIGEPTDGLVGSTLDTGWFGTQGYDAASAVDELADVVFYVHLKDVLAEGAHDSCRFGDGVVPLEATVAALAEIGYAGPFSLEHEPDDRDPTDDVLASRAMLQSWIGS
jgi:sugar phosphate isomerase/epimerase